MYFVLFSFIHWHTSKHESITGEGAKTEISTLLARHIYSINKLNEFPYLLPLWFFRICLFTLKQELHQKINERNIRIIKYDST